MRKGKSKLGRQYLLKPDPDDGRDHQYSAPREMTEIKDSVDLRDGFPSCKDQGREGSCAAFAGCAAFTFADMAANPLSKYDPSEQALYYDARAMDGNTGTDSGTTLRNIVSVGYKIGVGSESLWPYSKPMYQKPDPEYYVDAEKHQILEYLRVNQYGNQMLACLSQGFPFIFGAQIYSSFEEPDTQRSGIVPMPKHGWFRRDRLLGGHAMTSVGYDLKTGLFIVRNSWGQDVGQDGYFFMPFDYMFNPDYVADCWTIRIVEQG